MPGSGRFLPRSLVAAFAALYFLLGHRMSDAASVQDARSLIPMWTVLQELHRTCGELPDEGWRLERLHDAALPLGFSAKVYAHDYSSQPKTKAVLANDVAAILETTGGCGTAAIQEWVASARRWFDTSAQTLNQEITTTWPAPALLDPVRITLNALESSDEDDPGTLRMTVANPGAAIEVAFAGRDLQAGLCSKVSSTTIPVTEGTDRPGRMLSLAPAEAKQVSLKLDPSCFAEDSGALMGTLIVARKGVVEYRAILQLGVPRSPQTGTK